MTAEQQVRVVSYNLLSPALAGGSRYPASSSESLNRERRLERIWNEHLEPYVRQRAIICLQEVCLSWNGPLHDRFARHGYHFVPLHYGARFSDFMGVATAYPHERFESEHSQAVNVGSRFPRAPAPPASSFFLLRWFRAAAALLLSWYVLLRGTLSAAWKKKWDDAHFDPWNYSANRANLLYLSTLRVKNEANTNHSRADHSSGGKRLVVANYHMPCAYWNPHVMTLHVVQVAHIIQEYAGDLPVVFAGDFNITPGSYQYRCLTSAPIDRQHPQFPTHPQLAGSWHTELPRGPFLSAYAAVLGREPRFTNHTKNEKNEAFTETLDYIFTLGCRPLDVKPLPADPPPYFFPSLDQPSDHVLIHADLAF